ncbi:F-box-like domain containing protein [Asbolus verrucosus]|uniref:F-box-like domain containing protein n=1 Tax=Asbolus verrucosus TaxID=1661398 RepID=A0A482VFF5_ASBVE|nr:F-box-like domain containing protein [Asbolus verrucosus]
MNQQLMERLSPQPVGCPLVHLGHTSSSADETAPSIDNFYPSNERSCNYHPQNDSFERKQYYHQPHLYLNDDSSKKASPLDLSSLSLGNSYWGYDNSNKLDMSRQYYNRVPPSCNSNYLLDNFTKLGKSSPNLDQGYHTLAFSSPGPATPSLWSEGNLFKGKKYQNKNNSFDRLTDEIIIKIFTFLSSIDLSVCAMVCRRFNVLAWTPSLWRIIRLEGDNVRADRAIRGILRQLCGQTDACPNIERIHVTYGAKLTDKSLLMLARRCPELTHLQIQGCAAITNNALFEMASRCNNLQHLDVTGCVKISCISINPGPDSSRRLQLQYLDFTDCSALQDSGLRVIVHNCPQLTHLYLRRCVQITDAGLKFVPSFCTDLKELSVSDCINITDFGLYELGKLGPVLRYLSVAKCHQVSDAGLKVIARRCYKLRYLNARGCEAVSDDAIIFLARSCTRLCALDIGKCDVSDAGLRALAESCPNLKKLSLRSCDLVTDRGVQCVAYYCRGLQQLNIQDCQISLEGYRAVKKYCKRCVIEHTNPGFF